MAEIRTNLEPSASLQCPPVFSLKFHYFSKQGKPRGRDPETGYGWPSLFWDFLNGRPHSAVMWSIRLLRLMPAEYPIARGFDLKFINILKSLSVTIPTSIPLSMTGSRFILCSFSRSCALMTESLAWTLMTFLLIHFLTNMTISPSLNIYFSGCSCGLGGARGGVTEWILTSDFIPRRIIQTFPLLFRLIEPA